MGQGQSSPNPPSAESVQKPSVEELLQDALKPFELRDAQTYRQYLLGMVSDHKEKKDPKLILSQSESQLENIIQFLEKLEYFSTKEQRGEWYKTTYTKSQKSRPCVLNTFDGHPSDLKAKNNPLKKDLRKCKEAADQSESEKKVMMESLTLEKDRLEKVDVHHEKELEETQIRLSSSHSQTEERIQRLRLQNEDLTQRLAKEMSDKVSKDESSLENINIKNRPMIVAEEYNHFCTNAWFVAKEQLDKTVIPNKEALKTLSDVLKNAETYAKIKQKEVMYGIYSVFCQQAIEGAKLLAPLTPQSKMATVEVRKIPDGLKNAIGDFLRTTADTADISAIVEEIHSESGPSAEVSFRHTMSGVKKSDKLCLRGLQLDDYMKECARLAWKMSVQRPPMAFDIETGIGETWKGQQYQEVFYESAKPTTPGNVVKFYVFPTLKHNNATMVKGTVFVDKKHEN